MTSAAIRLSVLAILVFAMPADDVDAESAENACPEERVWKDYLARNLERTPDARFHFVGEPVKSTLIARFNDVEPPTTYAPEEVGFFGAASPLDGSSESPKGAAPIVPRGQMAVLVFISGGCVDYAGAVPVEKLEEMLRPAP